MPPKVVLGALAATFFQIRAGCGGTEIQYCCKTQVLLFGGHDKLKLAGQANQSDARGTENPMSCFEMSRVFQKGVAGVSFPVHLDPRHGFGC